MRIALAQFDVKSGNTDANLATASQYVRLAARRGAKLVVLPELWSSGYDLERCQMHARVSQEKVLPALAELARRHQLYILGSVLRADTRREVFNSAVLLGSQRGPARVYRKIHLFGPMLENKFLTPGRTTPIFHLAFGAVALAICYDLGFPSFSGIRPKRHATGNPLRAVACSEIGTLAHFGTCAGHRESILYRRL